jgi:hypothetical protein
MEVAAAVKTDTQHLNRRNLKRPAPQNRGASGQRKVIKRGRGVYLVSFIRVEPPRLGT